jgi:GTP cyclohydrolase I
MTNQIAQSMMEHLNPAGVGVIIKAQHSCMAMRGVQSSGTMMTSSLFGAFRDDPKTRAEFLALRQEKDSPLL